MEICAENTKGPVVTHRALRSRKLIALSASFSQHLSHSLDMARNPELVEGQDSALNFSTSLPCHGCGLHDRHRLVPSSLPAIR